MKKLASILSIAVLFCACKSTPTDREEDKPSVTVPAAFSFNIVNTYPHDTTSFTEGLQWYHDALYESTGNKGSSKLLKTDLKTGKAQKELPLEDEYFGEGITALRDTLYQMTWQEKVVFVYDATTFKLLTTFKNDNDGWGMTTDSVNLIVSDGTSNIYYRQPSTFKVLKIVSVSDNNGPVAYINELEYVDGFIYANIWNTNYIVKIDPASGSVVARTDLTGLLEQYAKQTPDPSRGNVLNGIAYNPQTKSFYITGKFWPLIFEMKL